MPEGEPFVDYEAIDAAITRESEMPLVTKWLVLGEAIDEDGDSRTFWFSSNSCHLRDELGLIEWHRDTIRMAHGEGEA